MASQLEAIGGLISLDEPWNDLSRGHRPERAKLCAVESESELSAEHHSAAVLPRAGVRSSSFSANRKRRAGDGSGVCELRLAASATGRHKNGNTEEATWRQTSLAHPRILRALPGRGALRQILNLDALLLAFWRRKSRKEDAVAALDLLLAERACADARFACVTQKMPAGQQHSVDPRGKTNFAGEKLFDRARRSVCS